MSTKNPLDAFADLVGKVPAEKIAETAGVELAEVEAWLAGQKPAATKSAKAKPAAPSKPEPRPRRPEVIRVLQTTAISIENARGRRVRLPVPCSIYRGDLARRYAALLDEDAFVVLEYER